MTKKLLQKVIKESISNSMVQKAIELATEKHKDQKDKGGADYINHPLRVMRSVQAKGFSETAIIAAILHDTVEDTDLTIQDVAKEFGDKVAETVALLSKQPGDTYEKFIDRIIASGNKNAYQVKLADLEDNMDIKRLAKEPDEHDIQRMNKYQLAHAKLTKFLDK